MQIQLMPTTEDEKPRKPKTPRAPRAKKVAVVVAAAVADRASPPLLNDSPQDNVPIHKVLETVENRVSASVSIDTKSAEAPLPQPLGANLSSYAPVLSVPQSLMPTESPVLIQTPEAPANPVATDTSHQLPTMQRPKISPLAPPNAANNAPLGKTANSPHNSLPISLLNTPQESADVSSADSVAATAPRDLRLNSGLLPSTTSTVAKTPAAVALPTSQSASPSKPTASANLAATQPGVMLRQAREARGLTVADVANRLRMGNRQVMDLEAGHFDNLPEGTFLRGFARNFSKVVGADTAAVLAALEAVNPDAAAPSTGIAPPAQNIQFSQHRQIPSRFTPKLGLLALVVVALSGATWYWFEHVRNAPTVSSAPTTIPAPNSTNNQLGIETPVPQVLNPAALNEPATKVADIVTEPDKAIGVASTAAPSPTNPTTNTAIAPAKPTAVDTAALSKTGANYPMAVDRLLDKAVAVSPTPPAGAAALSVVPIAPATPVAALAASAAVVPKAGNSTLSFVFSDTSWVEVADARGNLIVNRTFKKGETHQIEGRTPFSIVVGNSKNATMQYNGAPFDLAPHTKVSVARLRLK
jgi:cytoskeleton protein RodZ